MRNFRIILVAYLLVASLSVEAARNTRFATERLEQLAATIQATIPTHARDTCITVGSYQQYPLVAKQVQGQIIHLGIDIFGEAYKEASNRLLCEFAERYLLELLTLEDGQARLRRMYEDGILLMGDLNKIPLINRTPFRFSTSFVAGRLYRLEWHSGGKLLFSISVPAQCELIYGMNKIELEESFQQAVNRHQLSPAKTTTPLSKPIQLTEDLYVVRSGHYLLEQMQHTLFYTRRAESFVPLCDAAHERESLQNLLSLPLTTRNYKLDVTQRKYGFRNDQYTCSLQQMVDFCLAEGCTPYVGIESQENGVITAILIMVNAEYSYNHLFKIVFDTALLRSNTGHITATLNAYTPTHNLESLYDDERQIRHRETPKIKL